MGVVEAFAPLRWTILITDLEPIRGHEQGGTRRVLVVSYEPFHKSASVTVCPITAARRVTRYPNEVPIPSGEAGQTSDAVILCHQVRSISLERILSPPSPVGYLTNPDLRAEVRSALAKHLGLDTHPRSDRANGSGMFRP